jgi:hypothetical protein
MKNLSHFLPSTTQILNAGFLIEFLEVLAKFGTIAIIMLGV